MSTAITVDERTKNMHKSDEGTVAKTPNADCPACQRKRLHSKAEEKEYHPLAGHGYTQETGWTYDKETV